MSKEILEEAAENYAVQFLLEDEQEMDSVNRKQAFKAGAKWQQERMYSDIEQKWNEYRIYTNNEDAWGFKEWLVEQFKKKQDE